MKLCQFVYCLLSRSRKVSSLPEPNLWDTYMDSSQAACFDLVASADFLQDYDFGLTLRQFKGGEDPEFQDRCQEFFGQLVQLILTQHCVSADFMCGSSVSVQSCYWKALMSMSSIFFANWCESWSFAVQFLMWNQVALLMNS